MSQNNPKYKRLEALLSDAKRLNRSLSARREDQESERSRYRSLSRMRNLLPRKQKR